MLEVFPGQFTVVDVCRQHGIAETTYCRWEKQLLEGAHRAFGSSCSDQERRIRELERLVGQMGLELEMLKKASVLYRKRRKGAW